VTDSAGMKGRGSPVTGEIEVTRQPPLWPPRKVLNMAYGSVEPVRVQAFPVIPGRSFRHPSRLADEASTSG